MQASGNAMHPGSFGKQEDPNGGRGFNRTKAQYEELFVFW